MVDLGVDAVITDRPAEALQRGPGGAEWRGAPRVVNNAGP